MYKKYVFPLKSYNSQIYDDQYAIHNYCIQLTSQVSERYTLFSLSFFYDCFPYWVICDVKTKCFFTEKDCITQSLTCGSYYRCVTPLIWHIF